MRRPRPRMIELTALAAIGAEKILGNELKQLGYALSGAPLPGRVFFRADEGGAYRANLCLRTADRVYLVAASFRADSFGALFDGAYAANWQDYFRKDVRLAVDKVRVRGSKLASEHSVQKTVHKAICDKLCAAWRMRALPESGETSEVRVYIDRGEARLLLDLSGEPLHRRGYRTEGGEAPVRETLAAALLQLMCWRRKLPLHDPFCGSGTIACEAMLYAYNAPPGLGRHFALERLAFFDAKHAAEIRAEAVAGIRPDCAARISGSDRDPAAVERSRANAECAAAAVGRALQSAGSDARIPRPVFTQTDITALPAPYESGALIGNPPYGERLGDKAAAERLYRSMTGVFGAFSGLKIGFIAACPRFESLVGTNADRAKKLKSGKLDTVFYQWDARGNGDSR